MADPHLEDVECDRFLAELTELSRRHRIIIGGCGCCGSPYLLRMDPEDPCRSPDGRYKAPRETGSSSEVEWLEVIQ